MNNSTHAVTSFLNLRFRITFFTHVRNGVRFVTRVRDGVTFVTRVSNVITFITRVINVNGCVLILGHICHSCIFHKSDTNRNSTT